MFWIVQQERRHFDVGERDVAASPLLGRAMLAMRTLPHRTTLPCWPLFCRAIRVSYVSLVASADFSISVYVDIDRGCVLALLNVLG